MNVLLIDNNVRNYEIFNSAANANTIPIVYSSRTSTTEDILSAIRQSISSQSQTIARIGLVFEIKEPREPTLFLDNSPFFQETDIAEAAYSANVAFLLNLINEFQVANIDFLACNSLNQPAWVNYYALLTTATGVIVGASSDNTGNIQYGGDWIMESTSQDIQLIYFTTDIENYASLLSDYNTLHSIFIKRGGTVWGYGDNYYGALGLGPGALGFYTSLVQIPMPSGKTPTYISCSSYFTVILMSDGTVYGAGANNGGQLGRGNYILTNNTFQPMTLPSGKTAKYIATGSQYTLVLMTDGTFYGTGVNDDGRLGLGNTTSKNTLQLITSLPTGAGKTLQYIFTSFYFNELLSSFVLMTDGTVYGTGYNRYGQLGNDTSGNSYNTYQAMLMPSGKSAAYLTAGDNHTCVLMTDGTLYSTGFNLYGQCGTGVINQGYKTLQLMNMTPLSGRTVKNIVGGVTMTSVLTTDGNIYNTGQNKFTYFGGGITVNSFTSNLTLANMTAFGTKIPDSFYGKNGEMVVVTTDKTVFTSTSSTFLPLTNGTNVIGPFTLLDLYNMPCFNADTKILTKKGYRPVQELRKGDLIKTLRDGYKPIALIGKRDIYHDAKANARAKANNTTAIEEKKNSLYRCSQENYPDLFEELLITGAHAILVDELTDLERENTIEVLTKIYVTDGKYRLPACVDERATMYEKSGTYTIYHLALEHDNNVMNYGIYANGLLVETCSQRYLSEYSGMTLL